MKKITRIKCLVPFTNLIINNYGYCYSCCSAWTKFGNVGRLTGNNSIMDIWNNERFQYLRQSLLDDQLERVCDMKYCPYAIQNSYIDLETMKGDEHFNQIIEQIKAGQARLENPPYLLNVAISSKCNLNCIMCISNDKLIKNEDVFDRIFFEKTLPQVLPRISKLFLLGNGEVFYHPYARNFLQNLDPDQYPSLKILLLTNGTLFTQKLWDSIKHNKYESITISIDASTKMTYEKIRKNGNWDILLRNLHLISKLRSEGVFSSFQINFCVMKSNYHEMKSFVELGKRLGCDKVFFQRIYGFSDIRENINFTNNKKVFSEIGKSLNDPVFSMPEVDTTLINDYRTYADKKVTLWDDFDTKFRESVFYHPVRVGYNLASIFSRHLYHISEFIQQKPIPKRSKGLTQDSEIVINS